MMALRTALAAGLLLVGGAALPGAAAAETLYISDVLTVPLRSGPSSANRILHRGLRSGTALEVLGRDDESTFVNVRTPGGLEGWLPGQYLVEQPIARERLRQASARIDALNEELEILRGRYQNIDEARSEAESSSAALGGRVAELEQELAEIRRVSANAIQTAADNQRLSELNDRLRGEVDELLLETQQLRDNVQQRWLLIGAGLVLTGLLLGVIIKSRPRRSAWT